MAKISMSPAHARSLKNALRDRFPNLGSSHISEALAAAFGFKTNIAFVAALQDYRNGGLLDVESDLFRMRLAEFGHEVPEDFSFANIEFGNVSRESLLPEKFRTNIARMLYLEGQGIFSGGEIYALRLDCARMFAERFGLGIPEPRESEKALFKRWSGGVDGSSSPGWGRQINYQRPAVAFPGSDHVVRFVQRLPLSNGRHVEYASAMVSMPYIDAERAEQLAKAKMFAEAIGWKCVELQEWSWYAARGTTLALFTRKTPHTEIERAWPTSFKRWLIENKRKLTKSSGGDRRRVILDAINCPHLPLDLRDYDDCRERYLKEFAEHLYLNEKDSRARAFRVLFAKWQAETARD